MKTKLFFPLFIALLLPMLLLAQQKFASLGNFKLDNGQVIQNCRLGYRTFGRINRDSSNVILFPSWFSGKSVDLQDWSGPGSIADSTKYFVIAVDAFGDQVSSSPSNSEEQPLDRFPAFDIRDMVRSQHELLTRKFHIHHVFAVMGISMGGMQTFQWIVTYPGFMDKAVEIAGSPKVTSYDLLLATSALRAIEEGLKAHASTESIMKTVDAIWTMNLYTPDYRVTHTKPSEFHDFLSKADSITAQTFNPYDWASQLRAAMALDVSKPYHESMKAAAARVRARVLLINDIHDHMVNPHPAFNFAPLIHAGVLKLKNNCGHIGPWCARDTVDNAVNAFLEGR